MKASLFKGFLWGLGFSISISLVAAVFVFLTREDEGKSPMLVMPGESLRNIVFRELNVAQSGKQIGVAGKIVNDSNETFSAMLVEIEFFDDSPKFVTECEHFIRESIHAKSETNFSAICDFPDQWTARIESANVKILHGIKDSL